ncbi:MAG: phosphoenolpyruvate--protein phosphotransferase [Myxococcales bacterium]|nr:phosphoenolpyruvate--protein phosphotransferase [Myxococcales bacterium]MDH5567225.1 phosphoenolpyruvate--protein phosphotransferase [Myxococcales bacterium]
MGALLVRWLRSFGIHGGTHIPDRVTLLADVAEIVSRSHDLAGTLGNVVELVAKRMDADACAIYLVDADLTRLTLRATIGLNRESVGRVQLPIGEGLVGLAAQQRVPLVIERAQEHPSYKYFPETGEERFTSLMAVPLIVRNVTVGVLLVQTCEPRKFDAHEVGIFQTCAQLIAPVVINARLLSLVGQSEEQREKNSAGAALQGIPIDDSPHERQRGARELSGIATARGIAIGPVYRLEDPIDLRRLQYTPSGNVRKEEQDLMRAIHEARRDLDGMREEFGEKFGPDFAAVFNAHVQILEDAGFIAKLRAEVRQVRNALTALVNVLAAYRKTFERVEDPYFRERIMDVEDVGRRVMERILGEREERISLGEGAIVVMENILPTHFARLELDKIAAIVSEHGGPTSHGAIFARTLEIPAVTGVAGIQAAAQPGEMAIVDGGEGTIHLSPDEHLLAEYRRARERYEIAIEHLDALRDRPAETRDGRRISLTANCGLVSDLRLVDQHGAEGVGLFRTEMLALVHRGFPGEEEQKQLYDRVASHLAPRPVTIRTLDLGGDKDVTELGVREEENPQLGCRSIRLSLANVDAFRIQLRAVLRASDKKNVRLLLPMISSLTELRAARAIIDSVKKELARAGTPFDPEIPIGVMIEVPSAALTADILARECDFFSIGTNDLTQYTLAVDRGNEHVAHLYDPLHPGVLALIDRTVRAAARAGISVTVCGEMASNPLAIPILVGLGISELSGTPGAVPVVREIVHALRYANAASDARLALGAGTAQEVRAIGARRLRAVGLLEHPDIGSWLRSIVEREIDLD